MEEKLDIIATLLCGKLVPGGLENNWFIALGDPSQWETLKLFVCKPYGYAADMWRISYYDRQAEWKDGKLAEIKEPYREGRSLSINVNLTRPAGALVKDITKRLIIPAEKANAENVKHTQSVMDYDAKVQAFANEFGAMTKDDRKVRVYTSPDFARRIELSYIGDKNAVLTIDMPHAFVRKVINYIKEIVND